MFNVPNLRFPGFDGEWEEKKLRDLLEFKNGVNATKEQYGKGVKFVNVSDILKNDFLTYENIIGLVDIDNSTLSKYSVEYGDILFQRSSETREEVGTANVYLDERKAATFGGFVIRGKKTGSYDPIFFNNLLKSDTARNSITSRSGGSTRYNVGQETLSSVQLSFPSIYEQVKIGSLLYLIDQRVQTQNKIIQRLESLIEEISRKLFSRKMRFEEFANKWEIKSGNEIFANISDKSHNSDLPILAITQEHGAVPRDLIDYNIMVTEKSIGGYKVVQKGDFIISLRSFQGGIEYSEYQGICSPAYIVLRPIVSINRIFYKYYLKTDSYITNLNKKIEGIRDGKMISYKYFSEIALPFPSLEEQNHIADFLLSIEEKIKLEKEVLEKYEVQKKHLLKNLFI